MAFKSKRGMVDHGQEQCSAVAAREVAAVKNVAHAQCQRVCLLSRQTAPCKNRHISSLISKDAPSTARPCRRTFSADAAAAPFAVVGNGTAFFVPPAAAIAAAAATVAVAAAAAVLGVMLAPLSTPIQSPTDPIVSIVSSMLWSPSAVTGRGPCTAQHSAPRRTAVQHASETAAGYQLSRVRSQGRTLSLHLRLATL